MGTLRCASASVIFTSYLYPADSSIHSRLRTAAFASINQLSSGRRVGPIWRGPLKREGLSTGLKYGLLNQPCQCDQRPLILFGAVHFDSVDLNEPVMDIAGLGETRRAGDY